MEEAAAAPQAAALSCIAAALTSDAARTDLAELLSVKAPAAKNPAHSHGPHGDCCHCSLLIYLPMFMMLQGKEPVQQHHCRVCNAEFAWHGASAGVEFGARLASDLLKLSSGPSLAVTAEALAALQALAISQRGLLGCHWGDLRSVMLHCLAAEAQAVHAPGTGVAHLPVISTKK